MAEFKKVSSQKLGESYYETVHSSGLKFLIYPKEGYSSTYVIFGTRYGSIDTQFRLEGKKDFTVVPEGIAHFLEHKLFESEELDAFTRYAKTGASANAYTSFDKTCYLFSCSKNLDDSLEILLDFVTHPYFTPETVKKEQGIIGQEIKMCQDEASWEVLFSLLRAMYKNHPVKIDIAGTVQSISEITSDLLYECYNTFYNLHNMVCCVVGNAEPDQIMKVADKVLKKQEPVKIERKFHQEPKQVNSEYVEEKLAVATPVFALGFKENITEPERTQKEILESNILMEIICGKTSDLYNNMLNEGLINNSFDFEYFCGYGYAATLFTGESNDAKEVRNRIVRQIELCQQNGVSQGDFERIRRKLYGRAVMSYNDIEEVANNLVSSHFANECVFDDVEILSSLKLEDVNQRLKTSIDVNCCSLSVIKSEGE